MKCRAKLCVVRICAVMQIPCDRMDMQVLMKTTASDYFLDNVSTTTNGHHPLIAREEWLPSRRNCLLYEYFGGTTRCATCRA